VPPHVEAAIEHGLEKLAPDRFATAKEFVEAITGVRTFTSPVPATAAPGASARSPGVRPAAPRIREITLGATAVLGVAAAAWFATRPAPEAIPVEFTVNLPDSVLVSQTTAHTVAMTRDGRKVAILGIKGGDRSIYLRKLADPVAQPVRGSSNALFHSFSPTGDALVFVSGSQLKTVATEGGTPRTIADSVSPTPPTWTELGEILYIHRNEVWGVSSDGGNRRRIARSDTARAIVGFRSPVALPGGKRVLVQLMGGTGIETARLGIISLDDGEIHDLEQPGNSPRYAGDHVFFAREEGIVYARPFSVRSGRFTGAPVQLLEGITQTATAGVTGFAVSETGTLVYQQGGAAAQRAMFVADREGRVRQITTEPRVYREPRLSPDGRRVVVRIGTGDWAGGLWIFDIAGGTLRRLTPDSQAIRGEWSRDGRNVVYTDRANSDGERLASRPWDLSEPATTIVKSPKPVSFVGIAIGPRGGYSATRRGARAESDIWIAPADSMAGARPFITGPAEEYDPTISPDGKLLAYTSNETGRAEVYVTTIPTPGPRIPVSADGGSEPRWAREGSTLFYRGPSRLLAATIVQHPQLDVTRRDSLFVDRFNRYVPYAAYDVFPGGREFLVTSGPDVQSTIFVILNWQSLDRIRTAR
jgi:Tol biopolymer transport system component